jgi:hypothetical protein
MAKRISSSDSSAAARFKNLGDAKLAAGEWLNIDGKPAEVPGVW